MMFGAFGFFGGTSAFGGGLNMEEEIYNYLQSALGEGAHPKEWPSDYTGADGGQRARWLAGLACGLAHMPHEAVRSAMESVPCLAISQLGDVWERVYGVRYAEQTFGTYERRQNFMRAIMHITIATANPIRVENEVKRILDDDEVYVFENTGSTMISIDGVRYWCVLVPDWLAEPDARKLYFAVLDVLNRWKPAHTEVALVTSDDGVGPDPQFYLNGKNGSAVGKDCPGE